MAGWDLPALPWTWGAAWQARDGGAIGVDLSAAALHGAAASHPGVALARADVLRLPVRDGAADLLLDRGCFHYLPAASYDGYAREARRVLRPGGQLLLRACRTAAGVPTGLDAAVIRHVFRDWRIEVIIVQDIASDTRSMPALVARMSTIS